jgi:Tol biopolymer transport system component
VLLAGTALPVAASSGPWKLDLSSVFETEGETVIAEAPEAVKDYYCTVFSPDMRRVGYAARVYKGVHEKQAVYLNDEAGPMYDFVNCEQKIKDAGLHYFRSGVNSLTFSGDGSSFAYQARHAKQKWKLVLDGKEYDGIKGNYHFAPTGGTIAASNCESYEGCCWRTGEGIGTPKKEGEACPSLVVFPGGLGGQAVDVFYEFEGGKKRVVVGEQQGPWFKEVRDLRISDDGKHVSYVGCKTKGHCTAVFDGTDLGVDYERILSAVMDRTTGKASLIARTDKGFLVSYGGQEGKTYQYITPPVAFDGGGHAFYLATQGEEKFAILRQGDGKTAATGSTPCIHLMSEEVPPKLSATYAFTPETPVKVSPDGKRFAYLACCNSCCKSTASGGCKKAGCMAEGADFQMKVVVARNGKGAITKGSSSKCQPPGSIHGFTWSRDGASHAYALTTGKSSTMYVNSKAVAKRSGERFGDPLFTPDGSQVVFVSWKDMKGGQRSGRLFAGATPVSSEYDYIDWPIRISADGKRAAFNAVKGRTFYLVVVELQ